MKIVVINNQVYGLVESEKDLQILLKAEQNGNGLETNGNGRRPYTTKNSRKRHTTWLDKDIEIVREKGLGPMTKTALKNLAKELGRSVDAVRIVRSRLRQEEKKRGKTKTVKVSNKTAKTNDGKNACKPWTSEETQMVVETIQENPDIAKSVLFDRLSKVLGRSAGSINVRYYDTVKPAPKITTDESERKQIPINFSE